MRSDTSPDPTRECGPCTACCTVISVPELASGLYEPCQHLCSEGCGIYARRPTACRTWECQWLRGLLEVDGGVDLELRPDTCGVIFDYQPGTALGDVYTAWEVEPGASDRNPARDIVRALAEHFLVAVMTPEPGPEANGEGTHVRRRFVGPSERVAWASDQVGGRLRTPR